MLIKRKKVVFIAMFFVIAAVAIVLCVGYFADSEKTEYDGTLVEVQCRRDEV